MGGINGTSDAESAETACELLAAAAVASARSFAACFLRNRSSRAEIGGFTKVTPFRVGIILKDEENSDKDCYCEKSDSYLWFIYITGSTLLFFLMR